MARKVQTQIRQEQIAEAALEVVRAHGLRGLSMERVARQVGIVPSALYRHYKGKGDIFDAMIDLIRQKLGELTAGIAEEPIPPVDRIRALLARHVALVQHFQAIPRVLFSDETWLGHPARKARLYETISMYLAFVAHLVREAQEEGSIRRDVSADTIAVMYLGLFQSGAVLMFMSDGGFDVARHLERAWVAFLGGISASTENVTERSQKRTKSGAHR
ncbi:MAG: TetR/AcrR family transcriptional regulator [Candidatus Hydrogenedentes bacterium]|nr:TetR/AcrR family transcriptional regulator [Candidatus Hydrogenedentota bacterium]